MKAILTPNFIYSMPRGESVYIRVVNPAGGMVAEWTSGKSPKSSCSRTRHIHIDVDQFIPMLVPFLHEQIWLIITDDVAVAVVGEQTEARAIELMLDALSGDQGWMINVPQCTMLKLREPQQK